jgi:hypothetical protein
MDTSGVTMTCSSTQGVKTGNVLGLLQDR